MWQFDTAIIIRCSSILLLDIDRPVRRPLPYDGDHFGPIRFQRVSVQRRGTASGSERKQRYTFATAIESLTRKS